MRITHLGHSAVLAETDSARILIDPGNFSDRWHSLTDLDAVLVTHQHPDHLDPQHLPALLEANQEARVLVEPSIIVLYGRLRRMGPVLTGLEISTEKITNLLSVIGADCECGLDRSWLQGEMMPAKWDSGQLAVLTKQLGFGA